MVKRKNIAPDLEVDYMDSISVTQKKIRRYFCIYHKAKIENHVSVFCKTINPPEKERI